jgi:ubiquinol-cytochrome c reductase cytochrome b subunit
VLVLCVVVAAALGVLKGQLAGLFKAVLLGGAVAVVAMMLSIDAKFWGVVVMGGAVIILFFLPWLDNSPVKSIRYRPGWHKYVYAVFVVVFVVLGYFGVQAPSQIGERISQACTLLYLAFFMFMPWWSAMGEPKPVPERVTFAPH